MATIYYADGGVERVTLPTSLGGCLNRLRGIVGGDIDVIGIGEGVMVFHGEGKIARLPFNARATALARPYLLEWDWGIAGNAVVGTWEELELLDPATPDHVGG